MSYITSIEQIGHEQGLTTGSTARFRTRPRKGKPMEDLAIPKKMLAQGYDHETIKELTELSDQDLLSLED